MPSRYAPLRLALAAAAALLTAACGGSSGPVDGGKAYGHVQAFVGFGPRPFGSDALGKTADYIGGELQKLGVAMKRHEVVHDKEKKTIRNLYAQIDGEDPQNGPILLIGAHYDTKLAEGHTDAKCNFPFVGAIDGGGGPAVLIEVARALKARPQPPKCNVWLYWIDAEESIDWTWNDERALLGSKAFCAMLSKEKLLSRVKAFVLIDLVGSKDWKIDRDGNSDTKLLDVFGAAAKAMGEDKRMYEFPSPADIQAYRSRGINWGTKDDHEVFKNYGVPSVLLIDFARRMPAEPKDPRFEQWWHTADDDLGAVDADALAFTGNLLLKALPDLEAFVLARK
ncbi:MAG: M28 family peptidase [Phycisphaerales bacterium]|jgi:Zn-dependent M28 family amino/carboxypeptidase|nr:M28 family peptidase [Phycisphaerales bacterium]